MENEMCSICQEDLIGVSNILTTKCNHKFHTDCYIKYINSSHKNCCPICRQNVFNGRIQTNNSDQSLDDEYHDYVNLQNQILITSLRNENCELSSRNEFLSDEVRSLKHYIQHQNSSYDKKIDEIKLYDKKKYSLLRKKNNVIFNI